MMINALNSGARCFMADLEDANAPTWENCVGGQVNLIDAAQGTIALETPAKTYRLDPSTATLLVRPRGWHLLEKHVEFDGERVSASLFDFGLAVFHCARRLLERDIRPHFYLPKPPGRSGRSPTRRGSAAKRARSSERSRCPGPSPTS